MDTIKVPSTNPRFSSSVWNFLWYFPAFCKSNLSVLLYIYKDATQIFDTVEPSQVNSKFEISASKFAQIAPIQLIQLIQSILIRKNEKKIGRAL